MKKSFGCLMYQLSLMQRTENALERLPDYHDVLGFNELTPLETERSAPEGVEVQKKVPVRFPLVKAQSLLT